MTEDLERLVNAAEGQGPSAEFVAALRARIVAETEGAEDGADEMAVSAADRALAPIIVARDGAIETSDDIDVVFEFSPLQDDDRTTGRAWMQRRTQLLALAAAAALVFVGVWAFISVDGEDARDELDTVDDPTVTTEAPDPSGGGAPLTAGNTFFDAGTFRIDTLGTTFTFSVEETRGLLVNENDTVMITDLTSRNVDDRTITFRRTSLLPDPAAPTADFDPGIGWPVADLAGWLDLLSEDVFATAPTSSTLGGSDATLVELELPCKGVNCEATTPLLPAIPMFTSGSQYRLWVVDQGSEDPIVVVVAIDDADEAAWFDEADDILATLEFGGIEPNPLRRVPAGSIELDAFAGVSLELAEEVVVVEPFDGFARIFPVGTGADVPQPPVLGEEGDVEFLTRPLDTDGVEVTTTERLIELLENEAVVMTERATNRIGGLNARTFDIESGGIPSVVVNTRDADLARSEFGWKPPSFGHLWVIEHPERGLLLVSADATAGMIPNDALRPWTEELLRGLEFGES